MFHSDFVFFIPLSFIYIWRLRNKWFLRLNFYNKQCCFFFFHFEFYHILKRHGDPQTHDLDISIEFFHDYHIFYISYKNVVLLTNYDVQRWINPIKKRQILLSVGPYINIEFPLRFIATLAHGNVCTTAWYISWVYGLSGKPDVFGNFIFIEMYNLYMHVSYYGYRINSNSNYLLSESVPL